MVKVPCFWAVDLNWEKNSLNLIFVLQKDYLLSEYINLHNKHYSKSEAKIKKKALVPK